MASSKEYSYLAIDPGEIPVEDDLLMVTTNWVFVTKLFPFDSNRNMVSLENRKLLIECINESTEEVLLTTIDMHDRNLVEQKEDHYEIKHMLLKTGVFKVYFILDSMIVCLLLWRIMASSTSPCASKWRVRACRLACCLRLARCSTRSSMWTTPTF